MESRDDSGTGGGLKTIERAFGALEAIAAAQVPLAVKDVATDIGRNLSTTYHLVNTLVRLGYVVKDDGGMLRIGPRVALLNSALVRGSDFSRTLRPFVEELSAASGETVYLTRFSGSRVEIQSVIEGRGSLRVTGLDVGFSGSEDRRASGAAIMAHLPDQTVSDMLRENHPDEDHDQLARRTVQLAGRLRDIRARGFAFDDEEFEPGICCVAAPFFDAHGAVAGSLAVSGPAVRRRALSGPVRAKLLAVTEDISRTLGYEPLEDKGEAV